MNTPKWDSYRDGITKATVYTLTAEGERWSPQLHIPFALGRNKHPANALQSALAKTNKRVHNVFELD